MKPISLLLIVLIVVSACRKKIEPTSVDTILDCGIELQAIDVSGDSIIVCGGDRYTDGSLLVTHDGGVSWNQFDHLAEKAFYAAHWVNANRVIAAGFEGVMVESNNGGESWNYSYLNLWRAIRGIETLNNYTWLCGGGALNDGYVITDTDIGTPTSYFKRDSLGNEMRSLLLANDKLYCAGYGLILRSTDFGMTWEPTSAEGDFFIGLCFVNGKLYTGGMNGTVLESENDGATWSHVKRGNNPAALGTLWNAFDGNENGLVIAAANGKVNWYDFANEKWYSVDADIDEDITGLKLRDKTVYCCTRGGHVFRLQLP